MSKLTFVCNKYPEYQLVYQKPTERWMPNGSIFVEQPEQILKFAHCRLDLDTERDADKIEFLRNHPDFTGNAFTRKIIEEMPQPTAKQIWANQVVQNLGPDGLIDLAMEAAQARMSQNPVQDTLRAS